MSEFQEIDFIFMASRIREARKYLFHCLPVETQTNPDDVLSKHLLNLKEIEKELLLIPIGKNTIAKNEQ